MQITTQAVHPRPVCAWRWGQGGKSTLSWRGQVILNNALWLFYLFWGWGQLMGLPPWAQLPGSALHATEEPSLRATDPCRKGASSETLQDLQSSPNGHPLPTWSGTWPTTGEALHRIPAGGAHRCASGRVQGCECTPRTVTAGGRETDLVSSAWQWNQVLGGQPGWCPFSVTGWGGDPWGPSAHLPDEPGSSVLQEPLDSAALLADKPCRGHCFHEHSSPTNIFTRVS